ncbi:hypothetical protein HYV80_00705 [Candidatus Woesearchaeota archaeon]|nr:hypothetical protein [Candidatus Woesearchaeota archaeon]
MAKLVEKLKEIGKYEIGLKEFKRFREEKNPIVFADLAARVVGTTLEAGALAYAISQLYYGNSDQAATTLGSAANAELIKYLFHKGMECLDQKFPTSNIAQTGQNL